MKYQIDDNFVNQLFAHPTFTSNLKKSHAQNSSQCERKSPSCQVSNLVEQICAILSDQFKNKIDSQCLTIYQSHLQMIKQVQRIKSSMSLMSPTKSSICQPKHLTNSILSEVLADQQLQNSRMRKDNEEIISKIGNNSFMSSFIFESEAREIKQELEERINATITNLSGDVAKFESSVELRLRNVQNSLNRKMESIYKTLTSIFQTINDLQTKFSEIKHPKDHHKEINRKDCTDNPQAKAINKSTKQKQVQMPIIKQVQVAPKRRSFLGFIKY